jgi:hypothetical protein
VPGAAPVVKGERASVRAARAVNRTEREQRLYTAQTRTYMVLVPLVKGTTPYQSLLLLPTRFTTRLDDLAQSYDKSITFIMDMKEAMNTISLMKKNTVIKFETKLKCKANCRTFSKPGGDSGWHHQPGGTISRLFASFSRVSPPLWRLAILGFRGLVWGPLRVLSAVHRVSVPRRLAVSRLPSVRTLSTVSRASFGVIKG